MKCSNCGGIFHASTTVGECSGGAPEAMSADELLALSLDEFHRVRTLALADPPVPPDPAAPPTPDPAPDAAPVVEEEPSADAALDGPKFRIPVGITEGVMSSKGIFAPGSLTARPTPFPLMGIDKTTPEHWEAEIIGRVDLVGKDGNDWWAEGVLLGNERGAYFAQLIADQFVKGVSADIADVIAELIAVAYDDDGFPTDIEEQYTQGSIAGFTVCPFPAFPGAYIILVADDAETAPPPPPPTLEAPTPEQAAQGIRILSSARSRCGTCDDRTTLIAAAGPMYPPREWFENPALDGPTPLTITEDGRIFGHMAVFGECHIGFPGDCVTAPKSLTGYSHFNRFSVQTADGGLVATGVITLDTGHADDREPRPDRVIAHYDNTGLACADVRMGDDEYGIWIAGATRPDLDELGVRKLRGSALSGDWRWIGAGMEPVAALAVNVPGFPIVKSLVADGRAVSLVAAGGLPLAQIVAAREAGGGGGELAARLAVLERVVNLSLDSAKANLRARMEALA